MHTLVKQELNENQNRTSKPHKKTKKNKSQTKQMFSFVIQRPSHKLYLVNIYFRKCIKRQSSKF